MTDDQLRKIIGELLEQNNAKFFGQIAKHFDERFNALEAKVDSKADGERVYALLDGIAKRLETDEQERAAVSHRLDRQDGWIGQLAQSTNTKLVPEQ